MPIRRKIRGDGNCFYRAIMICLIEKIFICNTANRALKVKLYKLFFIYLEFL